ncbi:MAG: T9SS type A sorting domain-containing protein [Bacteroidales bacterium]|nr:T9SS type A sorting domain-containing protein [Bacteroidales bacterium]
MSCLLISVNGLTQTNHFITRGADTAEIYVTSYWYKVPTDLFGWGGIFRSPDNGATLTLQHKYIYEKNRNEIYGDFTSGTIYLQHYAGLDTLMVSHDFGNTYTYKFIDFIGYVAMASGCVSGEFYAGPNLTYPGITRFTDYGNTFQIVNLNSNLLNIMDVGTQSGELYALVWPYYWGFNMDTLGIAYSSNYGQNFSIIYQDTCLISFKRNYTFTRGTVPGEIYIIGQDPSDCYHIFHSTDYGQTLELKHISEPFLDFETTSFTAGRVPGSFYMMRYSYCYSYHADLWIYYSNDYGATFTTYYHSLDSTLTGEVHKDLVPEITVFPNPAANRLTFRLGGGFPERNTKITLYDLFGKPVAEEVLLPGHTEIILDTRNLTPGIYFYGVVQNNCLQNGKILIIK